MKVGWLRPEKYVRMYTPMYSHICVNIYVLDFRNEISALEKEVHTHIHSCVQPTHMDGHLPASP